ncbi:MAG: primosomal protein N' [Alphaproteobacteria bacterium]|nr:primosomal protein N' [Alphaproteobacteria bacterium]
MMTKFVGVLLPLPFNDVFDYKTDEDVSLGQIVRVPFLKNTQVGVVYKIGKSSVLEDKKIKSIIERLALPPLKKELLQFVEWVAKYNLASLGLVLKMVLSAKGAFESAKFDVLYKLTGKTLAQAKLKNSDARWHVIDLLKHAPYSKSEIVKGAGVSSSVINKLIETNIIEPFGVPKTKQFYVPKFDIQGITLTPEQQNAADYLCAKCDKGFNVTLLDGVTGSGKTEVYFEAAIKTLKQNKQVLILVPEIALTTQWLDRYEKRFGVKPANWHSGLSINERTQTWQAVIENRAKVVVGARSALFLPFADLGLIVVDESHDHSFKQEDMVNYQARDMAIVRAKLENIPIILSTATPDLETVVNVEAKKYDCVKLVSRYANAQLPEIKIVDLKKDKPQKSSMGTSWLSPTLVMALKQNLEKGEQSMLFLNRRGYAPLLICRDCGHRIACPNCTAWLTEHRKTVNLICHHCGYSMPTPKECPDCHSTEGLTACGPGVERIAEEVKARFEGARVEIISSDITSSFMEVSNVIGKMQNKEIDILIGTQILAKGHHFPLLTLVGIVDADLGLMGTDLRASEQTYQLLSQVSGRAGRGDKKGTVYLQTLYPENAVLQALIEKNREGFSELEKKSRKALNLPPFGKLAALIVSSNNEDAAQKVSSRLIKNAPRTEGVNVLGPAPAPIYMLRGKYRYRLLLKTLKTINIQEVLKKWLKMVNVPSNVRVEVDIDPYSFM